LHVYKLINLCTCVCRSYTSGCRQNAEEEEKKRGRERKGNKQGSGDKERIRRGFQGKEGKGGKKRGARKKKHMDLFKNTAIYQSQAHSESRSFQSKRKD